MKKYIVYNICFFIFLLLFPIGFQSCIPPLVDVFDDTEKGVILEKADKVTALSPDSTVVVMTWNIRFGIGRGPWFGDACGYKVVYNRDEVLSNLQLLVDRIELIRPDILLLQEVDINSNRSGYTDQFKWLLDHTYFNYAAYGSQWKTQFIPSDGLGRLQEVNAIYSRWPITECTRTQLALRKDQIAIERYFYERCCMVTSKIEIPGFEQLSVINLHASAFATDSTKFQHIKSFENELDRLNSSGYTVIGGGDLNTIPPQSDSTDYCLEEMCPGESFHHLGDEPFHRPGADFTPEKQLLVPVYAKYQPVIPLNEYLAHQGSYFTSCSKPDQPWKYAIDYMFTNSRWKTGSGVVHQECVSESDHCPVSGMLVLKKKP